MTAEPVNESEVVEHDSPLVRHAMIAVGTVAVVLGVMGIFLPLLPTTPFLLLAAACYARSSRRFYVRLLTHPWFGEYIRDYRAGRGVPLRVKATTLALLWRASTRPSPAREGRTTRRWWSRPRYRQALLGT